VDDLNAYLAKAVSLGKTMFRRWTSGPERLPGSWFSDPDGNIIGLWTPKN
jgi:predicted enzyme related to lactoylglutathione lyase